MDRMRRGLLKNPNDSRKLSSCAGIGQRAIVPHMPRIKHIDAPLFASTDQLVVGKQQRAARAEIAIRLRETALVKWRKIVNDPQAFVQFNKAISSVRPSCSEIECPVPTHRIDIALLIGGQSAAGAPDTALASIGSIVIGSEQAK